MADPTLVLLGVPVKLKGTNCAESGQSGVDDSQINIMTQIDPYTGEEDKVRYCDDRVEVAKGFRGLGSNQSTS